MTVKPGFKQTEVGVIPDAWDVKAVGDAFEIRNQLRLPISQTVRERMPGSYPYYGPTSVQGWINEFRVEGEHALIGEDGDHFLKWREKSMTLLVNGKFNVNNHAHIVRGTQNLTAWFYWFFANRDISSYLTRQGAGRYKLTKASLLRLPCAIPKPPEQRAIAETLSDVDRLLNGLNRLIAKKRNLKQAAMQQLLTGQTRLPGFDGEWEVKRIGEFAECTAGGTPSTSVAAYWGGSIRWMSSGELNLKRVQEVEGRITEEGLENSSAKKIPMKCVLIGLAGQGKTRGTVAMNFVELCTNQSIAAIFPSPAFVPEYLYYNLDARYDELRELSAGDGGRGGLNLKIIKSILIPFPTLPEQSAIGEVLTEMDAELAALEQRREKTHAVKQAMMQVLLTGRRRLISPKEVHA